MKWTWKKFANFLLINRKKNILLKNEKNQDHSRDPNTKFLTTSDKQSEFQEANIREFHVGFMINQQIIDEYNYKEHKYDGAQIDG